MDVLLVEHRDDADHKAQALGAQHRHEEGEEEQQKSPLRVLLPGEEEGEHREEHGVRERHDQLDQSLHQEVDVDVDPA